MIKDFTPSLEIKENIEIKRIRAIPKNATLLVKKGEEVKNNQIICKILKTQEVSLEKISEKIGIFPDDIKDNYVVNKGDYVKRGDVLLNKRGLFNFFNTIYKSNYDGQVEFISKETGTIGIRPNPKEVVLKSYLTGIVEDIKEDSIIVKSNCTFIQGVFGVGEEKECILKEINNRQEINNLENIDNVCYFCNFPLEKEDLVLISKKSKGLIIPSISSSVLNDFLGYDISIPITGNEEIPTTIIITEGFGNISFNPNVYELLKKYENCDVSINGATQIRAGAVRPEILIFNNNHKTNINKDLKTNYETKTMKVRILRDPYFGQIGEITEILKDNYVFENEVEARAVRVKLRDREVVVPKANIEVL